MNGAVSNSQLEALRDAYQEASTEWDDASDLRRISEVIFTRADAKLRAAKHEFEAAGGLKELLRRSVEQGEAA